MRENTHAQTIVMKEKQRDQEDSVCDCCVEYLYNERFIHVLQDIKSESSFTTLKTVDQ